MPRLPINVDIRSVVRNARAFNPKHWRNGAGLMDDLLKAVDRLFALLGERRTDYLLVGGIALLSYVEGRNTEDIDLIIATAALATIPELLIQDVVGVPHEAIPGLVQLPVQTIEHDVRQQRRDHSSLRRANRRRLEESFFHSR